MARGMWLGRVCMHARSTPRGARPLLEAAPRRGAQPRVGCGAAPRDHRPVTRAGARPTHRRTHLHVHAGRVRQHAILQQLARLCQALLRQQLAALRVRVHKVVGIHQVQRPLTTLPAGGSQPLRAGRGGGRRV
jgi:hypothetical protein